MKGRFPPDMRGIKRGRIVKKNRTSLKNIDLFKPWVTDAMRTEFAKKDELLAQAKQTQSLDDWKNYRDQREKCSKIYQEGRTAQVGQQEVRIPQLMPESNFKRTTAPIDYTADVNL